MPHVTQSRSYQSLSSQPINWLTNITVQENTQTKCNSKTQTVQNITKTKLPRFSCLLDNWPGNETGFFYNNPEPTQGSMLAPWCSCLVSKPTQLDNILAVKHKWKWTRSVTEYSIYHALCHRWDTSRWSHYPSGESTTDWDRCRLCRWHRGHCMCRGPELYNIINSYITSICTNSCNGLSSV